MSEIYQGPIRVKTTTKDGDPLLIKTGPNTGKPWCRVSFKVDEAWIDVMDFKNEAAKMSEAKVAYSVKVDDFGDPLLYNGKLQYNLDAIKSTGDTQTALPAPAGGSAQKEPYNAGLGAYQTALNCATQLTVALIGAHGIAPDFDPVPALLLNADTFHAYLTTGHADPLDVMLAKAKETFEEPPIGFDDKPDPAGDEDIPF